MRFRKTLISTSAALALGTLGVAATVQSASAHVVCNSDGDCWSTHSTYKYPPDLGVTLYSDRYADQSYRDREWRDMHRTWRDERHDRGYYKGGVWVQF
jgi:hypothetical protein